MKKTTLVTIALIVIATLVTAFKTFDADKKHYMTIYSNDQFSVFSLSGSDGSYKTVPRIKSKGLGDQAQLLSLINELEGQGYKILNYDHSNESIDKSIISVLMVK